jgi:alkanesulfonate monooxygenase SsuD/methylene tetrahydromethanopterin reductase-like flavin-dependent oxidoreductase (luciferase family)
MLAARLGLRLMLPSAFGNPVVFRDVVDLYREHFTQVGHGDGPAVGACWHVNVAPTSQQAHRRWEPRYRRYHGWMQALLPRVNPDVPAYLLKPFDYEWLTTNGPAIVGSPAEVVDRLQAMAELLTAETHLVYLDMGGMPVDELFDMIRLMGTDVIPHLEAAEPLLAR